jgi:hypothetical protein
MISSMNLLEGNFPSPLPFLDTLHARTSLAAARSSFSSLSLTFNLSHVFFLPSGIPLNRMQVLSSAIFRLLRGNHLLRQSPRSNRRLATFAHSRRTSLSCSIFYDHLVSVQLLHTALPYILLLFSKFISIIFKSTHDILPCLSNTTLTCSLQLERSETAPSIPPIARSFITLGSMIHHHAN